jgi:hypothetical protein
MDKKLTDLPEDEPLTSAEMTGLQQHIIGSCAQELLLM